jgi:hypothetical protein
VVPNCAWDLNPGIGEVLAADIKTLTIISQIISCASILMIR